nr:hypothetical protein [Pseudomonas chlororaphis]
MPNDLSPWKTVYQKARGRLRAGCLRPWGRICGPSCALRTGEANSR